MTRGAPLGGGGMAVGQIQRFFDLGVTARAELFLAGNEKRAEIGGVGTMTFQTFALSRRIMSGLAFGFLRYFVTVQTERRSGAGGFGIAGFVTKGAVEVRMNRCPKKMLVCRRVRPVTLSAARVPDG